MTVLVPTYNRANFLPDALEGLLRQTLPPEQIIVIDDGSTDTTRDVVEGFGPSLTYLHQNNSGKSVALNLGLERATGRLIWIFDDDDVPEPDALERLTAPFLENPTVQASFGLYDYLVEGQAGWRREPVPDANPTREPVKLAVLKQCYIHQPGMLVSADLYRELGGFDPTMLRSQDYEMLLRLTRKVEMHAVRGPVFAQRRHSGVRGPGADQQAAHRSAQTWRKYDGVIFRRIYAQYDLSEYLPPSQEADVRLALVTRLAVMARRGLWDLAAQDLQAIRDAEGAPSLTGAEARQLETIFGWAGHGLQTMDESAAFFAFLSRFPAGLRRDMARAITKPLFARLRPALKAGDLTLIGRIARAAARTLKAAA